MHDAYGLEVSTDDRDAIEAINHFSHQVVSNGPAAIDVLDAANHYSQVFLLQCYAATLFLYAQTDKATAKAQHYLKQAQALSSSALTEREQLIFQSVTAWCHLDYASSVMGFIKITTCYPNDVLCGKYAEWLFYCLGQKEHAASFLDMCQGMQAVNRHDPYFLSMFSFALELVGRQQEAMAMAQQAMDIEPVTPWAHHTLAHVFLFQGKLDEGQRVLTDLKPLWDGILPPLRGHILWHLGLFSIAERDQGACSSLLSEHLWGANPGSILEQIDVISFLWRMDMAGLSHHGYWQQIAPYLEQADELYTPFNTLHQVYALSKAGNQNKIQSILAQVNQLCQSAVPAERQRWQNVGIPVLTAVNAFAQHDHAGCLAAVMPIIDAVFCVGGSDAQVELLQQMALVSLIRQGDNQKAQSYFKKALPFYQKSPLAAYWDME